MYKENTTVNHVALQYKYKEDAETFFSKILNIPLSKKSTLNAEFSQKIFGINENVDIQLYDDGVTRFEIFISNASKKPGFEHTSIEIDNEEEFITRCKQHNIQPINIDKQGKKLLFVKDKSGNLFEIKTKKY